MTTLFSPMVIFPPFLYMRTPPRHVPYLVSPLPTRKCPEGGPFLMALYAKPLENPAPSTHFVFMEFARTFLVILTQLTTSIPISAEVEDLFHERKVLA